jgi:WD40 repeat protein
MVEQWPAEQLQSLAISLTVHSGTESESSSGLSGRLAQPLSSIELPAGEQLLGHSFSPDETRLMTWSRVGSEAGPIRIWDVATASLLHEMPPLPKPEEYSPSPIVRHIVYAPDGLSFAAAFDYGTIRIYDTETSVVRLVLEGHGTGPGGEHDKIGQFKDILSIEFNASGDKLVSTGRDKTVRIWDTITGQPLNTFELGQHPIAALSTDGQLLATSDLFDGRVQVWDLRTSSDLFSFQHPVGRLTGLRFDDDQRGIIVTNDNGASRLELPDIFNMAPKERVRVACNRLRDIGARMRFAKSDQFAHAALGGEPEDLGAQGQSFASPCPDVAE